MADAQAILAPLQIPDTVKADAWDAVHQATSADDLAARLQKLPLSDSVRADLYDAGQPHFSATATAKAPRSIGATLLRVPDELVQGIGSGVISTGLGAYNLLRRIPGASRILPEPNATLQQAAQPPDSYAGKAGKLVEQGAEFLAPMGEVAKVVEGAPLAARLAAEAATAGATAGVQTGGNVPAMAETALTTGALGGAGAAIPAASKAVAIPLLQKLIDSSPRALSDGAIELAQKFGVPLTRGMEGGSRTVQAAEKLLGHSVASDLYEPVLEEAQQGVNAAAKHVSGDYATDRYTAGDKTVQTMLGKADEFRDEAQANYDTLEKLEADPANTRTVQVGSKQNMSGNPAEPDLVPDMRPMGLPVDMRPAKQLLAPEVDEIQRFMTQAQRRADPGLAAIQNILGRPDHLPASVAEGDLSYLKEVLRSEATPQAKRLAAKAIDAMEPQVQAAIAQAGPAATAALNDARGAWQARASILDQVKDLSGSATGQTGQVRVANRLLQPSDASFPALEKVLVDAPEAAADLGHAYLADRVFKSPAAGEDFTNAKQASNLWNQMGPRTKEALYTPDQIADVNNLLELAKRVAENPNPSGTGTMNMLIKMGVMITHPGAGAATLVFGRNLAKVLYSTDGAQALRKTLAAPASAEASKAMLVIKSLMDEAETPRQ